MALILDFVSTRVGQVLLEDIPAHEKMALAYFFWERSRLCLWRVTVIPKKYLSYRKSFIANSELCRDDGLS